MTMPEDVSSNILTSAIEFWHKINTEKEVVVKFTKKDGTVRIMRCTLDFTKIPKEDRPKKVDIPRILELLQKNGIMHVYDLDKKGWRSVPFQRAEYLRTRGNVQYRVRPLKRTGVEENVYSKRFNK
jgi:hypothetical protein